jgi:hypothetical protein
MRTRGATGKDTLPGDIAEQIRDAVRRARKLKGLRNRDLANYLERDERTVTSVFESAKPLRFGQVPLGDISGKKQKGITVPELIQAIRKSRPRRDGRLLRGQEALVIEMEAHSILNPASALIANFQYERWPIVLIAKNDMQGFAVWLTDRIGKLPGISKGKVDQIRQKIASILLADHEKFASAAHRHFLPFPGAARSPALNEEEASRALACFGYKFHSRATQSSVRKRTAR